MHARIDELLSLRDGEPVAANVPAHVESCATCASQLTRLKQMQQQMQSLASFDPPAFAWERISARVQPQASLQRRRFVMTAAAVVSVLAVVIGFATRDEAPPDAEVAGAAPESVAPEKNAAAPPLDQLVAQSRELDELLQHLPERPSVERVAMAGTIDTLQDRIQWLDVQLSYAPDTGLNDAQAYRLWRERVDLMDSLVKVRYAQARRMSF